MDAAAEVVVVVAPTTTWTPNATSAANVRNLIFTSSPKDKNRQEYEEQEENERREWCSKSHVLNTRRCQLFIQLRFSRKEIPIRGILSICRRGERRKAKPS